jgi:hypothetical protein
MVTAIKETTTKGVTTAKSLSTNELSALYDRIYDIADRSFKKHNPCNVCTENSKTKCINNNSYIHNHLCCQYYDDPCRHWQGGCTVKCLACKLFVCGAIRANKKNNSFIKILNKLRNTAFNYGFSNFDYYMTKKKALQHAIRQRGYYERY